MAKNRSVAGLALSFYLCVGAQESESKLYVYRIGGAELPPPTFSEEWDPPTFVQLPWSDLDEAHFGSASLVDLSQDFILPEQVDPETNLTPLVRSRGGWVKSVDGYSWKDEPTLDFLLDKDPDTAYSGGQSHFTGHGSCTGPVSRQCGSGGRTFGRFGPAKGIWIDLGGLFAIREIRIYPTPTYENERFLKAFAIGTNDGDPLKIGTREKRFWVGRFGLFVDYEVRYQFFENTTSFVALDMEDIPSRHIVFESYAGDWEIAEFEIYAQGFAPTATYSSNIIDLEEPAALGELTWSGLRPQGTELVLTTRSGDDEDPNFYWRHTFRGDERSRFDAQGKQLTKQSYDKLEGGEQAGISPDTQRWEFWTPPLDFDRQRGELAGRRPRQFVQFRAEFESERPTEASSRLDYLEFRVTKPPLVNQVWAEIDPVEVVPREVTRFSYKILPDFGTDDQGFDSIEIETPVQAVSVDTVILSFPDDPQRRDVLDVRDLAQVNATGFVIPLPAEYRRDQLSSGSPIEVIFRAEVFTYGTEFVGRVFDRTRPWEVRQRIEPGDADPTVDSNSLSVGFTDIKANAVGALELSSPVFTPNGDGVNDELRVDYELVNLVGSVPVVVGFFDLSGRMVAQISSIRQSGKFIEVWDGIAGDGSLAAPGLYVIRMEVTTDESTDTVTSTVALAY